MTLYYIGIAVAVIAILFVVFYLQLRNANQRIRKIEKQNSEMRSALSAANDYQQSLASKHEEAQANIFAMQRLIQPLPQQIEDLQGKLREQLQQDPQIKLYQKAAAMAKQGATADEIASECDLPVAEASVLVSLHR